MHVSNKKLTLSLILSLLTLVLFVVSCARQRAGLPVHKEKGIASWYGPGFHGKRTASGERYNQRKMTAAHKTLPFGTIIKVINLDNMKSAFLKINDRGPFTRGRILDVSKAAAKKLDFIGQGTARVLIFHLPREKETSKEL